MAAVIHAFPLSALPAWDVLRLARMSAVRTHAILSTVTRAPGGLRAQLGYVQWRINLPGMASLL